MCKNTEWLPTQKELDSILILNFLYIYYENFEDYCVYFLYVEPSIFYTRQFEEDWRKCHEILFWMVFTKLCWHIPILVKIVQK